MTDYLEEDIRRLLCDDGPLDRKEAVSILLDMLYRIQRLEAR